VLQGLFNAGSGGVLLTCLPDAKWKIQPTRILSGVFETSLNAPGFSISLCNISAAARELSKQSAELLDLFDSQTTAVAWPNVTHSTKQPAAAAPVDPAAFTSDSEEQATFSKEQDIIVEPRLLDEVIRSGCKAAIAAEPNLTKWDMVMGDGDCGEAVQGVSEGK
jgi:triose/dihydroxyacetone kinase / FAD-AMP lyase (cyclizing)